MRSHALRRVLLPARVLRRAARHAAFARQAARVHRTTFRAARTRLRRLIEVGYRLDEIRAIGLLDPAVDEQSLPTFLPARRLLDLQLRLDPLPLTQVVHDKALFHFVCELAGLPVPRLSGFLYRDAPGWTTRGRTPAGRTQWSTELAAVLPEEFVVKPAGGSSGEGIRMFRRDGGGFREGPRRYGDAGALYDTLLGESAHEGLVIEERLRSHEDIARFSGSETLQTLRLTTLVGQDGQAELVNASLKLVLGDSLTDNFQDGVTGNGIVRVDRHTGRCTGRMVVGTDERGYVRVDRQPRTGALVSGFQVPEWDGVRELVLRAARVFRIVRTIGWDIAVTPDGPVIVEGNSLYGPPNEIGDTTRIRLCLEEAVDRENDARTS